MNGSPVIKQTSSDEARNATHCTRCGARHSMDFEANGYVVERHETKMDSGKLLRDRIITKTRDAKAPKHSYCFSCAKQRKHELELKDAKSQLQREVKRTGSNQHYADCTIVAISLGTGLNYNKVAAQMKRQCGFDPKTNMRGVNVCHWEQVLRWAADQRGYEIQNLLSGDGGGWQYSRPKIGELIRRYCRKGERVVFANHGHAMAMVNGKLLNDDGIDQSRKDARCAWRLVKKEQG